MKRNVWTAVRHLKTKSETVGNFDTYEQAYDAMLSHFRSSPKRGEISYTLQARTLEDRGGGIVMWSICIDKDFFNGTTFRKFTKGYLMSV